MKRTLAIIAISLLLTGCAAQSAAMQDAGGKKQEQTVVVQSSDHNYINIDLLGNLFGFTNETGKLILVSDQIEGTKDLQDINSAIGENGNVVAVKYLKTQKANEKDNGRQTSQNFDNQAGHIFEVTLGSAKGNETYYMINTSEFNTMAVSKSREGDLSEMDSDSKEEIEGIKGRKILRSWEIGRIEPDRAVYLIFFEREKDDMLASIVVKTPVKLIFKDYPAKYDESSTWRVDDGGSIYPEMFSVLFACETEKGMILGIKWMGAEGEVTTLLREQDGTFEELEIEGSRYMAPL